MLIMTSVSPITEKDARQIWSASSDGGEAAVHFVQPKPPLRLKTAWHALVNFFVPIGYEDEWGFHYGRMPAPSGNLNWTI